MDYSWNKVGSLTSRIDQNRSLTEDFFYDDLHRLTGSTLNTIPNLSLSYDALGNILTKSDAGVGTFSYDTIKKHAVKSAPGFTFTYDANGNQITRNADTIVWSSYNYPIEINNGPKKHTYAYDANRQRWQQVYNDGAGNVETTIYVGGVYEKNLNASDTDHRHYVHANGQAVALYTRYGAGGDATKHLLYDHQGSVAVIHDGTNPVPYESFTAFGERRDPSDWSGPPSAADKSLIGATTDLGMTGQDNLEGNTLIHMNGRVMDSLTGRFISADPFIPNPGNTQSFNRYSYVNNNPLSFTDPSGFTGFSLGGGDSPFSVFGVFGISTSTVTRTRNVPPPKPLTGCLVATAEGCYGKPGGGFKFEIRVDIPGLPNPTYGEEDSLVLYYVHPQSSVAEIMEKLGHGSNQARSTTDSSEVNRTSRGDALLNDLLAKAVIGDALNSALRQVRAARIRITQIPVQTLQ